MFNKKNGIYSITFHAQNKVKESNHKRRILSPGIRWQMTSPKELSLDTQFLFYVIKKKVICQKAFAIE